MSSSNCWFLTCIQVSQEADQVVWYSHLFQNFPHFIVIHTVKGFGIVNKAEIGVFLELSCFFDDPVDVGTVDLKKKKKALRRGHSATQVGLKLAFPQVIDLRDHIHWCDICSHFSLWDANIHKIIIMIHKIPRNLTVIPIYFLLNPPLLFNTIF